MTGFFQPMRRALLAAAVGVLLLSHVGVQAEDLVYVRFADYLESLRLQTGIPGLSAAIVGRSDVLWERGFGYQDVARAIPMRPDTPSHLDGLTQTLSAAAILSCAEDRRLSLDATVGTTPLPLLQARCVGGSTAINSGIIWRLPEDVRQDWVTRLGLGELKLLEPRQPGQVVRRTRHQGSADFALSEARGGNGTAAGTSSCSISQTGYRLSGCEPPNRFTHVDGFTQDSAF